MLTKILGRKLEASGLSVDELEWRAWREFSRLCTDGDRVIRDIYRGETRRRGRARTRQVVVVR